MNFFGAGGHAKVVLEMWQMIGGTVGILVDENPAIKSLLNLKVKNTYSEAEFLSDEVIISIGDNKTRKMIDMRIKARYGKVIHAHSCISSSVKISPGVVVMGGAVVNSETIIGNHCIINTASSVDHDCFLAPYVHISPGATICGGVTIGEGTHIGAGAVVIPNVTIGKWAVIGAGSVVIRDVPDFAKIIGVPGKGIEIK